MFGCLPCVSEDHHSDGVLHNYYTKMALLIISNVFRVRRGAAGNGWGRATEEV